MRRWIVRHGSLPRRRQHQVLLGGQHCVLCAWWILPSHVRRLLGIVRVGIVSGRDRNQGEQSRHTKRTASSTVHCRRACEPFSVIFRRCVCPHFLVRSLLSALSVCVCCAVLPSSCERVRVAWRNLQGDIDWMQWNLPAGTVPWRSQQPGQLRRKNSGGRETKTGLRHVCCM
jgi:hypothetical protein